MYKRLTLFFFCLFPIFSFANPASHLLEQQLSQLHTYQANFTQTTLNNHQRALQTSIGRVFIARPEKFRWEITKPNQQIILLNGKTLWIDDVDLEQVTEQTLTADQIDFSPASLLSGAGVPVNQVFSVQQNADGSFLLMPRTNNSSISKVQLFFQKNQLVRLDMWNALGQHNVYAFSAIRQNQSIPASAFQLVIPKGVDILKNSEH